MLKFISWLSLGEIGSRAGFVTKEKKAEAVISRLSHTRALQELAERCGSHKELLD